MNESTLPRPDQVALALRKIPSTLSADGLSLHHSFVSPSEATSILEYLDEQPWDDTIKRRTQHYGRRFDYQTKSVDDGTSPTPSLPPCIASLVDRLLAADPPLVQWDPLNRGAIQVTVNEYVPGVGIASHVDTHSAFGDGLCSLTLGAGVTFRLQREGSEDCNLWLPPCSLLVMTGAARYAWKHSIGGRRYDRVEAEAGASESVDCGGEGYAWVQRSRRVSITLRLVLDGGCCRCAWPQLCDSQGGAPIALPTRLAPTTEDAPSAAAPAPPPAAG